jgi:hypothetical protein
MRNRSAPRRTFPIPQVLDAHPLGLPKIGLGCDPFTRIKNVPSSGPYAHEALINFRCIDNLNISTDVPRDEPGKICTNAKPLSPVTEHARIEELPKHNVQYAGVLVNENLPADGDAEHEGDEEGDYRGDGRS